MLYGYKLYYIGKSIKKHYTIIIKSENGIICIYYTKYQPILPVLKINKNYSI